MVIDHPHTKNIKGQKFGKLFVESFANLQKKKAFWNCLCDCGNKTMVKGSSLISGKSKSCGCSGLIANNKKGNLNPCWKGYGEISGCVWKTIKYGSKVRDLDFEITIEQIWDLFLKQDKKCALSGIKLKFSTTNLSYDGTASLDRIDSERGYFIKNVAWVHKDLNIMKQDHTDEDFIDWCSKVSDYQRSKNLRD